MNATPDNTLADPEQIIADLRRQLAESNAERDACKAELDEALAQQTATAQVLQVINSSPGDLTPVFDAMLQRAMALCEADYGHIHTWDGQRFDCVAIQGNPEFVSWRRRRGPVQLGPGTSPLKRLMEGESVVNVADALQEQSYRTNPRFRELVDASGIRSTVAVALRKEFTLLGVIIIYRREVRPFSDKQIALLQNFAEQAVIAIENARLLTETRQALEQQTATAEVLQVINSSPGDLAPVFEAMLDKAMRLCEADFGLMLMINGAASRVVAERSVPEPLADFLAQHPPEIGPDTFFGRAVLGRSVLHTADMKAEAAYSRGQPLTLTAVDLAGVRALLMAPLHKDGGASGVFAIFRREARPFADKQISLLQNFAAQAVIAMENARLLTETREALEQQTATAEVLRVINSSPGDLTSVFEAILEKAHALCGADHGALAIYDGEHFHVVALHAMPEQFGAFLRQPYPPYAGGAQERLLRGASLVHIPDILVRPPTTPIHHAAIEAGIRTLLIVPLRKDDHLLGYITANRREVSPFSDKQIALLQNFAAQAVIAMENARLLTETREALEQQTATAEVLAVINFSPGDLAPVFEAILEKAIRLGEAAYGQFATYDREFFHFVAKHGTIPFLRQHPTEPLRPSRAVTWQRIVSGEPLVHIHDLADTDLYRSGHEVAQAIVDIGGGRTLLTVALRKDDALLGALTVYRQEVRPFADKQIALLQNFAAQAVIAMENARLLTETREALEQQTATAEVLQVINASPGDLAPVFDAMLDRALRLCSGAYGSLLTFDGEKFLSVATRGDTQFSDWARQRGPFEPPSEGPLHRSLRGEDIVEITDLLEHSEIHEDPVIHRMVELGGYRSLLNVALRKENAFFGVIAIYRKEKRPFDNKEIALLRNFAAQAVIAMENARLLTETREALEQQTATAEVLQVINSSPGDLAPVFEAMLEKATRLCEAPFGNLRTWDGERFHFGAVYGDPQFSDWVRRRGPLLPDRDDDSPLGQIIKGEQVVRFTVAPGDEGRWTSAGFKEMVEISGMRSGITVALNKDGAILGTISVYRQEVRPFSDKQIGLLKSFAAQAVIAMENARLIGELHERTDQVAELNRGLEARVAEQVDELGRVGRLKRFLAPQLAELIVSQGNEKILESHRREIVVVFCDLRGYTAFTETAEPEEVLDFLRDYHGALGPLVAQFEGTLDQFSGDGIMVFFNDPVPCPDPAERAVRMAMAMREAASKLIAVWRRHGCELGFGVGIAQGYATLGQIGFSERSGYTAIGTVCNLAARLCAEAKDGQILISSRISEAVEAVARLEDLGNLELKGLHRPVAAFNVVQSTGPAEARPNLTVVARGPGAGSA